ncbi:metal-dependent hydrolase [Romboutsia ilealis]|uniref:metal-dependent hydrolase n=1 Tax=Romboutsia ilealis TaxID=1115758 RepID=UPI002573971E|nr:metal-dependent hydrolase [Romboutsia ilealis]
MRGKTHCTIGILSAIQACILFKVPISIFNLVLAAIFSILPDLDESNSTISNVFLKQDVSKFILKIIIYIINFAIFFISLKINNNFFLSSIITFIAITVLEAKLNHILLRKIFLSLTLILLSLCLLFIKVKIYFVIFFLMLASFPWLKHRSFSHSIFAIIIIYFLLKQIERMYNISNLTFSGTIGYASHLFLGDLFTKSGIPLFYPISNKKYSLGYFRVGTFFNNALEILIIVVLVSFIIFSTIKI